MCGRSRGRTPSAAVAVAIALFATIVRAAPGQFELDWSGPAECPGADQVRAEVTRILHGPIRVRDEGRLAVRGVTERLETGRFHMDLETKEGDRVGRRSLDAATCRELASSAAVLIAILVDPESASKQAPGEGESASSVREGPDAPSFGPDARVQGEARTSGASRTYDVGVALGGEGGVLPSVAPGIGLRAGIEFPLLRFEVGGFGWLSTRTTIDRAETQGADFQLLSFYGQTCAVLPWGAWSVAPCAGGELEFMRGTGFGSNVTPIPNHASFGSILAGATVRWKGARGFGVRLDMNGIFPAARPPFVFSGSDGALVYQPSRAGARLSLSAEYRFE